MLYARSASECRLYIDLTPCECGARTLDPGHHLRSEPDGSLSAIYEGDCPGCGRSRQFVFTLDPRLPPPPPAFGGPDPSRIICPGQFMQESIEAARRAHTDPTGLTPRQRASSQANLEYAVAALAEVMKFIPAGADAVPAGAFTSREGRNLYDTEPGRFRGYRLQAVIEAYQELLDRHRAGT